MSNKETVRGFVDEAVNGGREELIDELVQLVPEGNTVVGRFACSATHRGEWRGHAATGRHFEAVDGVYFFTFDGNRIAGLWGVEDTLDRFEQLGLDANGP